MARAVWALPKGLYTNRLLAHTAVQHYVHGVPVGSVVRHAFGPDRLPGVLVVDRYAAYNQAPCRLQYCYAHLLREVQDLPKTFPNAPQVRAFVEQFAPFLAQTLERALDQRVENPAFDLARS
jgi:hypothetical protein